MGTPGGQRPSSSTPPAAAGLILHGMGSNEYKAKLKQLFEVGPDTAALFGGVQGTVVSAPVQEPLRPPCDGGHMN